MRVLSDTLTTFVSGLVLGAIIASHTNHHISSAVMGEMSEAVMPNEHTHISSPIHTAGINVVAY